MSAKQEKNGHSATGKASRHPSQVKKIISDIRLGIARREFDPGEVLVEGELAKRFNVSRQPIREALAILDNEGLIERLPRFGSRVRVTSSDEVREILILRCAIECLVVSELAARDDAIRKSDVAQIDKYVEISRKWLDSAIESEGKHDKDGMINAATHFMADDEHFHAEMAVLAGFNLWAESLRKFRHKLMIHHTRDLPTIANMRAIVAEHVDVVAAIRDGKIDEAKQAIYRHISLVAARYFPAASAHLQRLRPIIGVPESGQEESTSVRGGKKKSATVSAEIRRS